MFSGAGLENLSCDLGFAPARNARSVPRNEASFILLDVSPHLKLWQGEMVRFLLFFFFETRYLS